MKKTYSVGTKVYVISFKDNKWIFDGYYITIDEIINLKTGETFYVEYYENYEDSSIIVNANNCFSTEAKAIKECNKRNKPYRVLVGD